MLPEDSDLSMGKPAPWESGSTMVEITASAGRVVIKILFFSYPTPVYIREPVDCYLQVLLSWMYEL